MNGNVITANFRGGRTTMTAPLWQYDYGQVLRFTGVSLPETYEVHFSNAKRRGDAKTAIGDANGVVIPDEFLATGDNVYAWIFLHVTQEDGETEYMATIPVNKRATPSDEAPTPQEQSAITQAIAALNSVVVDVQEAVDAADSARASATSAASSATAAAASEAGVEADADRASNAATAAESAQGAAEAAQAGAETAQTGAESARDEAAQASAAQIAEINATGAAVLESIPADYTELSADVGNLKSDLSDLTTIKSSTNDCDPNAFTIGLLSSSGVVDTSYTSRKTTDFIPVSGNYVSAYSHKNGSDMGPVRIAFYNSDKTFNRIITVNPAIVLPVNEASFVRISFSLNIAPYFVGFSDDSDKMPFEEFYPDVAEVKESALPSRITATDNWIYKFSECDFVGGNVHLSIDDVGSALYALATTNPASLWESALFAQLKTLHETYGICITCNCFSFLNTIEGYDIASVPNTWASEFVSAKDWLKFAFHAKDNTINYNTADSLKTDYEYFVSAIYNITGDYDCIDTGTRLTSFTGTESQIKETMSVNKGITMLWSADDNRNSYYFSASQTARVNNRGKYIDGLVGLLFVKSMPRLDNNTIADIEPLILTKPQYGKMVELYCHENLNGAIASGTITRINNALAWFNSNGYTSHFLSDIFN